MRNLLDMHTACLPVESSTAGRGVYVSAHAAFNHTFVACDLSRSSDTAIWARSCGQGPSRVGSPMLSYSTDQKAVEPWRWRWRMPAISLQRTDGCRCLREVFLLRPV